MHKENTRSTVTTQRKAETLSIKTRIEDVYAANKNLSNYVSVLYYCYKVGYFYFNVLIVCAYGRMCSVLRWSSRWLNTVLFFDFNTHTYIHNYSSHLIKYSYSSYDLYIQETISSYLRFLQMSCATNVIC